MLTWMKCWLRMKLYGGTVDHDAGGTFWRCGVCGKKIR